MALRLGFSELLFSSVTLSMDSNDLVDLNLCPGPEEVLGRVGEMLVRARRGTRQGLLLSRCVQEWSVQSRLLSLEELRAISRRLVDAAPVLVRRRLSVGIPEAPVVSMDLLSRMVRLLLGLRLGL